MHKRHLTVIGIVLIEVMILFAAASFQQEAQSKKPQTQENEATVVQKGQVTEKEREYSKEYKKLYSWREGRKLSELRGGKQDVKVIADEPDFVIDPYALVVTRSEFLRNLSCSADAIVVGSVKSKSAHLTEDETFVYTEYEFSIKEVVKNNTASPIEINNSIEIARPGGVIKLDNRRITVEDKSYEPLLKNKDYLLFLRFVPSTNGYVVASAEGDFILEDNSFKKLSKQRLPKELKNNNPQDLLSAIRNAISVGCNQNSAGGN
jgi:hypothetical protein